MSKRMLEMNLINTYVRETTKWEQIEEAYLDKLTVEGAKENTLTNYRSVMKTFRGFLNSELDERFFNNANLITHNEIVKFQRYMLETRHNSPSTVNQNLAKLNAVFSYAKSRKLINHIPTEDSIKVKEDKKEKELLSESDYRKCLQSLDRRTFLGARTHVVMTMLNGMGMRVSELVDSKVSDYDMKDKTLFIPTSKNRKSRTVPINEETFQAIKFWLEVRKSIGTKSEYFLVSPDGTRVKKRAVQKNIKDCFNENNLSQFSTHDLRHKFVSDAIKRGVPIHVLSKVGGHSEKILNEVYTHFNIDEVRNYFK